MKNEFKTFVIYVALAGVLVSVLAFLYSPNDDRTNTTSVIENIESRFIDEEGDEPEEPAAPAIEEPEPEVVKEPEPEVPLTEEEQAELQRKRIHFTKILLLKQQKLEELRDKKNRTPGSTEAIDREMEEVRQTIDELTEKIRNM